MGGLASVLGGLATGYTQAAQVDRQRQFEDSQARRSQMVMLLGKLAADDTVHPEIRQWATQSALEGVHTPYDKKWEPDFKNMPVHPAQPPQTQTSTTGGGTVPGAQQQLTVPAPPPGVGEHPPMALPQEMTGTVQGQGHPTLPLTAELTKPGVPAGIFKSPEQMAQEHAHAAGLATQEQLQSQIGVRDAYVKQLQAQGLSPKDVAIQSALAFGHPIPSWTFRAGKTVQMTAGMARQDPELSSLVDAKLPDQATVVAQYGSMGEPQRITQNIVPSLAEKSTKSTESMDTAGNVTKVSKSTRQLPQLTAPQAPPGGAPATSTPTVSGQAGGKAAAEPKSTAHVTRSAVDWSQAKDPITASAVAWASKGIAPKGGVMAERQVLSRMKQMGLEPSQPVPPNLQKTIQESFVARNSAIGLIDDIMKNSQVLDKLISAGKIAIAADPDGNGILTRAADLNDREAKVAGDFGQLIEHANLLRGPLGATGFRGKEAWNALQMQRGKIMSDPRITRQMLTGMRERLLGLNNADKMILSGEGRSTQNAAPPADSSQQAKPSNGGKAAKYGVPIT